MCFFVFSHCLSLSVTLACLFVRGMGYLITDEGGQGRLGSGEGRAVLCCEEREELLRSSSAAVKVEHLR